MRMRTACFARAPQRYTSRLSKHLLLTLQEVTPLSKTRNQLSTTVRGERNVYNAQPVLTEETGMPFFLKRGGNNVPLEVQRWQYFLRKQNISQVGRIDGQFGLKTENATKFFQVQHGIS